MLNKQKIRLMTRLAIYDKRYGGADRKKGKYFKWDYIYFRNFSIRVGVLLGCLIIAAFYEFYKIFVGGADILSIDLKQEATRIVVLTIVTLVIYTIIGTIVAKKEYKDGNERMDAYLQMLDKLQTAGAKSREPNPEEAQGRRRDNREGGDSLAYNDINEEGSASKRAANPAFSRSTAAESGLYYTGSQRGPNLRQGFTNGTQGKRLYENGNNMAMNTFSRNDSGAELMRRLEEVKRSEPGRRDS